MNDFFSSTGTYSKLTEVIIFINKIEPYYIITLISCGLIGNTISFLLFTLTKLK